MLPRHHPQRTRLDAILCAFDDAVRGGSEPHIDVWLADWPDLQTRCTAVAELLCVGCELRDFDYAWLADQFRRWSGDLESRELRIGLLRALAHDQVETGRQLEWAHFRPFRFSPEELDLRDDGDLFSLGSVVASRFSLDARIGSGAFGVVYRATELATGRSVALKAPRGRDPDAQQHAAQRLVAEGALLARFACAQVLRLFETATTEAGTPLLVMELITGGTLADMLRRGPLPLDEALSLTEQIAMGLDGSHRLGLVHRDLKPANVLIDSRGRPVLADFGIALDENAAAEQEGMIVGTLGRMSVESLLGIVTEVDGRADVWALGGLLYEMITGEPLISAESREASLVGSVLAGTRRLVFPSHVPENVQRLIECAVSRDQKLRFDRAADVAEICRTLRTEPHAQPTMPVVRPPLVAWRLGLTMAVVCERLQAFRAGMAALTETESRHGIENRNTLAITLAQGHGAVIAYEEVQAVAAQLSFQLPKWDDAQRIGEAFYRGGRLTADTIMKLAERSPEYGQLIQAAYDQLCAALRDRQLSQSMLFEFGFESGCSPWSGHSRARWRELAERSGLPPPTWESFALLLDQSASAEKVQAALAPLNRSIERQLRFADEPPH